MASLLAAAGRPPARPRCPARVGRRSPRIPRGHSHSSPSRPGCCSVSSCRSPTACAGGPRETCSAARRGCRGIGRARRARGRRTTPARGAPPSPGATPLRADPVRTLGVEHVAAGRSPWRGCSASRTRWRCGARSWRSSSPTTPAEASTTASTAPASAPRPQWHSPTVAAAGSPTQSAQANDLLGVLVVGGRRAGADAQAIAAFQAAVRADPSNADAKYNLELALRRALPTGVRRGPGTGAARAGPGAAGPGPALPAGATSWHDVARTALPDAARGARSR